MKNDPTKSKLKFNYKKHQEIIKNRKILDVNLWEYLHEELPETIDELQKTIADYFLNYTGSQYMYLLANYNESNLIEDYYSYINGSLDNFNEFYDELFRKLISIMPINAFDVEVKFFTKDVVQYLSNFYTGLELIPESLRTLHICKKQYKYDRTNVDYIPQEILDQFFTEDLQTQDQSKQTKVKERDKSKLKYNMTNDFAFDIMKQMPPSQIAEILTETAKALNLPEMLTFDSSGWRGTTINVKNSIKQVKNSKNDWNVKYYLNDFIKGIDRHYNIASGTIVLDGHKEKLQPGKRRDNVFRKAYTENLKRLIRTEYVEYLL